jgi:uncharacterized protein (DUF305 family)
MDNKLLVSALMLIVGLAAGWFIAKGSVPQMAVNGYHEMPNGQVMLNNGMNMDDMMGSMTGMLDGKVGDAFDRAFIDGMIVHHQGAVAMAKAALKFAKHQEVKDMANAIITTQTKEIEQMKQWKAAWYK